MKWIFWALAVSALVTAGASGSQPAAYGQVGAFAQEDSILTGGVFICHHPPGLVYTDGLCAGLTFTSADDQNTMIPESDVAAYAWYIISGFTGPKRFKAVEYGIDYDPTAYIPVGAGVCAPSPFLTIEYPEAGAWPADGSSISIALTTGDIALFWRGTFITTGYIGGYHYTGTPDGLVELVPSPLTQFIGWLSGSGSSATYVPACVGAIGLDVPGEECTPVGEETFACCMGDGSCQVLTAAACATAGGTTMAETSCVPNPCPVIGGCCVYPNCFMVTEAECASFPGSWHPGETCVEDGGQLVCNTPTDDPTWGSVKAQFR